MRGAIGKYETLVRLGPVLIVFLFLLLNIKTTYVLHDVRDQLTGEVDRRLASSLVHAQRYLVKNQVMEIGADQMGQIKQKFGITEVGTRPISDLNLEGLTACLQTAFPGNGHIPRLDDKDWERLLAGDNLYCSGEGGSIRLGMTLVRTPSGDRQLLYSRAVSDAMEIIGHAARMTLYLAAAVLVLIVPIVIGLPRQILKPFKKMRETAQSAGRPIPWQDSDEVTAVIESYQNIIDELKRNEAELARLCQESSNRADRFEKLNRYILKSIGSGVINVDLTGRVIGYNRAAMEILGYDEDMVLDKHYLVAFPQEMELSLLIGAGLERGKISGRKDIELKRPGWPDKWLGVESSIIHDDSECVVGVTLLVTDLTELKKLESELETNRRLAALGEMTGGLAHQLRNSLAAISGFSQLLQKKTGSDSDIGDIAGSIRSEAASSEKMVSRFLNFAKPLSLTEEVFDLRQLTGECAIKYSGEAEKSGTALNLLYACEDISVVGDPLLLKEALCNILANALEAAGAGGQVDLKVEVCGTQLNLTVSDDGPGIPQSLKDKLFTPFVSSKPSGTGLGLALARKIVNLHNGLITFESRPPHGTICRLIFPDRVVIETSTPV